MLPGVAGTEGSPCSCVPSLPWLLKPDLPWRPPAIAASAPALGRPVEAPSYSPAVHALRLRTLLMTKHEPRRSKELHTSGPLKGSAETTNASPFKAPYEDCHSVHSLSAIIHHTARKTKPQPYKHQAPALHSATLNHQPPQPAIEDP